jgi:hypothetical protein
LPAWWPIGCVDIAIPLEIREKIETEGTLTVDEVADLIKICKEVRVRLLAGENLSAIDAQGRILRRIGPIGMPALIGKCRNEECMEQTGCICSAKTLTPKMLPEAE